MAYTVLLLPVAEREWRKLPHEIQTRVNHALLALENTPRPRGATKLSGSSGRWRIRVGDYRIICSIDDTAQEVTTMRIAHRRQVYR